MLLLLLLATVFLLLTVIGLCVRSVAWPLGINFARLLAVSFEGLWLLLLLLLPLLPLLVLLRVFLRAVACFLVRRAFRAS